MENLEKIRVKRTEDGSSIVKIAGDDAVKRGIDGTFKVQKFSLAFRAVKWFAGDWWKAGEIITAENNADGKPTLVPCVINGMRKLAISHGLTTKGHAAFVANKMNHYKIGRVG